MNEQLKTFGLNRWTWFLFSLFAVVNLAAQPAGYYFMIFPYAGNGASIDYKQDGTIPQVSLMAINMTNEF